MLEYINNKINEKFLSINFIILLECNYPCDDCETDGVTCKTCKTLTKRISITDCGCIPGYFDNGVFAKVIFVSYVRN